MRAMLDAIREDTEFTAGLTRVPAISERVLAAMAAVPREHYVPQRLEPRAYVNEPLPIGHGQTISQPFIVALMTHLAEPGAQHKILEIGTGSGYQAAILAELTARVYSVEILPELAASAEQRLREHDKSTVQIRVGDGWYGWPEHAPFDRILITAVARAVPPQLLRQLHAPGRLVLPIGEPGDAQTLVLVEKGADGTVTQRDVLPVRFVPMTGANLSEPAP